MAGKPIGTIESLSLEFGIPLDIIPEDIRVVPVYVNPRMRTRLGVAKASKTVGRLIELNPKVAADREQCRSTLAHEIAHHIAGLTSGHNWRWQTIARALGHSGERCATVEAAERIGIKRLGRVVGRCTVCRAEIRRARALPTGSQYRHAAGGCNGPIARVD